jgi:hypothetical protein
VILIDEEAPETGQRSLTRTAGRETIWRTSSTRPVPPASRRACASSTGASVALTAWAKRLYSTDELAGVLYATSATFDVSVFESLVPLCLGGER